MIFSCYVDASYNSQKNIGVISYIIINNDIEILNKYEILNNIKNTQLEILGVNKCIEECSNISETSTIIIYTDCQKALQLNLDSNIKIIKVKGHSKKTEKDENDIIFSKVDKKAKKILRSL